jgi:UDP-2,3-diacylglucosamine hydrolase
MSNKLGIFAGGGGAPRALLNFLQQSGRAYCLICLEGQAAPDLGHDTATALQEKHWLPLGAGERAVKILRDAAVQEIVMIGSVRRPSLLELKPDAFTLKKLLQAGFAMLGDDGLLRAVGKIIEAEGFRLIGIQDLYAGCLTKAGQLGQITPTAQDLSDIARGVSVARQLGQADIGQAVIVQQGIVLGVEAIEGTDRLIARCGELKREGGGGVLVKLCKPQQDRRFDLPTIGLSTVQAMHGAGLAGIAIEAGASLFIEAEAAIDYANRTGLFVLGWQDSQQ